MARLTLPMFILSFWSGFCSTFQSATKPRFFEIGPFVRSQRAPVTLWRVTTYILSLLPSSVLLYIWKVQRNLECICRRLFFFVSWNVFFFKNKIIDPGLHHHDKTRWENVKYGILQVPVMWGASYATSLSLKWRRYEWVSCCCPHSLLLCSNVTDFLPKHVQMYSHNKWLQSSVAVNGIFNEGLRPRRPVVFCWPSRRIQTNGLSNWQDF